MKKCLLLLSLLLVTSVACADDEINGSLTPNQEGVVTIVPGDVLDATIRIWPISGK